MQYLVTTFLKKICNWFLYLMWCVLSCQPLTHVPFHLHISICITYQQTIQSLKKKSSLNICIIIIPFLTFFLMKIWCSSNTHSLVKPWHMSKVPNLMYLCHILLFSIGLWTIHPPCFNCKPFLVRLYIVKVKWQLCIAKVSWIKDGGWN